MLEKTLQWKQFNKNIMSLLQFTVFFASTTSMHTQSWSKLYRMVRGLRIEASEKVFDCGLIEEIAFMISLLL